MLREFARVRTLIKTYSECVDNETNDCIQTVVPVGSVGDIVEIDDPDGYNRVVCKVQLLTGRIINVAPWLLEPTHRS